MRKEKDASSESAGMHSLILSKKAVVSNKSRTPQLTTSPIDN